MMASDNEDQLRQTADELMAGAGFAQVGTLAEALGTVHEIYLTLKTAGFSEFQSLWIIGYVVSAGSRPQEEES
jgi:hypothetical protein